MTNLLLVASIVTQNRIKLHARTVPLRFKLALIRLPLGSQARHYALEAIPYGIQIPLANFRVHHWPVPFQGQLRSR
jgi:hypothetical protein